MSAPVAAAVRRWRFHGNASDRARVAVARRATGSEDLFSRTVSRLAADLLFLFGCVPSPRPHGRGYEIVPNPDRSRRREAVEATPQVPTPLRARLRGGLASVAAAGVARALRARGSVDLFTRTVSRFAANLLPLSANIPSPSHGVRRLP